MNALTGPTVARTATPQVSQRAQRSIDWLRDYAGRKINSRLIDERRCIPPYIVLDFGNQGLLGMRVPKALGGKLELSLLDALRILQQLGAIDITLAIFVGANNSLGIQPILNFAKREVRDRLMPDLASGRILPAFGYSEPDAGSNPLDIQANARELKDGKFLLSGSKVFIGNAYWAGFINVFANHVSVDGKTLGQVAFCVPATLKGIRHGSEALTMGIRGMVQNAVVFDNVCVAPEYMLGQPGGGLAVASDAMLACRLAIASICVGAMRRALQLAGRYAGRRVVGATRLIDSDLIRARLASMYAAVSAADDFVSQIASDLDEGVPVPSEAYSAAKAACSEWSWEVADTAIQMLGARGYIETNCLAQMSRDLRAARIAEGPTDTMFMHVGRRVLDPQCSLFEYIATRLGKAAAAETLRVQLRQLREQCQPSNDLQSFCHRVAGELATLHLIRACSRDPACLPWLDTRLAWIGQGAGQVLPMSVARSKEILEEMAVAIGDIEQAAPDEDRSLDAYLCRELS